MMTKLFQASVQNVPESYIMISRFIIYRKLHMTTVFAPDFTWSISGNLPSRSLKSFTNRDRQEIHRWILSTIIKELAKLTDVCIDIARCLFIWLSFSSDLTPQFRFVKWTVIVSTVLKRTETASSDRRRFHVLFVCEWVNTARHATSSRLITHYVLNSSSMMYWFHPLITRPFRSHYWRLLQACAVSTLGLLLLSGDGDGSECSR